MITELTEINKVLSNIVALALITSSIAHSTMRQYLSYRYSEADFEVFRIAPMG